MIFKLCWFCCCCYGHAQAHSHAPSPVFLSPPPARCFLFICATFTDFLRFYIFVYVFRASLRLSVCESVCLCVFVCLCVCCEWHFPCSFPTLHNHKVFSLWVLPPRIAKVLSALLISACGIMRKCFFLLLLLLLLAQGVECCSFSSDFSDLVLRY